MKLIFQLLGIAIILGGILLIVKPDLIYSRFEQSVSEDWFYVSAIIVRFFLGVLFVVFAKQSRFPTAIRIFGILSIVAALIFILVGKVSFQNFLSDLIPQIKPFASLSGLFAIVAGYLIFYAFKANKNSQIESTEN